MSDHDRDSQDDLSPMARALFGWVGHKYTPALFFWGLLGLGVALIAAELIIDRHDYVHMAENTGFYGIFGFLAFSFAVLTGWPLGRLLRRDENYYGDQDVDDPPSGEGKR